MTSIYITRPEATDVTDLLVLLKQQYEILHTFYPNFYHNWGPDLEQKSTAFLNELLVMQDGALVARVEKKAVGLITFSKAQRGHFDTIFQEFVDITELIVDSDYRSLGIGQKLIDQVKEIAKQDNVKLMRVVVSKKNERGIAFYERSGFEIRELTGFMEV